MMPRPLLALWLMSAFLCWPAAPQDRAGQAVPTVAEIQAQIEAHKGAENAAPLLALYTEALESLQKADEWQKKSLEFQRDVDQAPALIRALQEGLKELPAKEVPAVAADGSLADLERALQQEEANSSAAQQQIKEFTDEASRRAERLKQIPDEIARVRQEIKAAEETLKATPTDTPDSAARRTALLCSLAAKDEKARALEKEQASYEARRELLPLRRDQSQRALTQTEQLVAFYREQVSQKRQDEARKAAQDAERRKGEITSRFPALTDIATRNEKLAGKRTGPEGFTAALDQAKKDQDADEVLLGQIHTRFLSTVRKLTAGGLNEGMGSLLRRELEKLPTTAALEADWRQRQALLSHAQLELIDLEDREEEARDPGYRGEQLLAALPAEAEAAERGQFAAVSLELLQKQRELRDALKKDLETLVDTLLEHQGTYRELLTISRAYRSYIQDHILWVRSTVGNFAPRMGDAILGLRWLVGAYTIEEEADEGWKDTHHALREILMERPDATAGFAFLFLGLLLSRRALRRALASRADPIRSYRTDHIRYTLEALAISLLLAAPASVLLWWVGWTLAESGLPDPPRSVGLGMSRLAQTVFLLSFLRQLSRDKGLGESHFRWPSSSMKSLRVLLRWFVPLFLPFLGLALIFDRQTHSNFTDSIGRMSFVCSLLILITAIARCCRPTGPLLAEFFRRNRGGLIERTHRIWSLLLLGVPIYLVTVTGAGYYYAAFHLARQFEESLALGLLLALINALLLRWLFIVRRRLAVEQAQQRAQARAEAAEVAPDAARESGAVTIDEDAINIPAVDAQTRKLFKSCITLAVLLGFYFIWADSLPALRALDRIQLWPRLAVVSVEDTPSLLRSLATAPGASASLAAPAGGATANPPANGAGENLAGGPAPRNGVSPGLGGVPAAETAAPVEPDGAVGVVTLADLIFTILIVIIVTVAALNIPGLLEITILQRLPLDSGSRYALSTLVRYAILIIGLSVAFGTLGIGWSKVQWLATALIFGLSFGLQEVFANFVSGIIMLVERPVRVGDIVSVSGVEGRVTRLRMRATTILDWDRRELLVPNKEFITGSVINWTLSDPITRVVIPVGIAYGSDTRLARTLLLKVARENPLVLEDPNPSAIFRRFGDSTLDFELRVFMANRDLWPQVIDQIHSQIDDAFRAANVEIAFPQRDLHIRSAEGLSHLTSPSRRGEGAVPEA